MLFYLSIDIFDNMDDSRLIRLMSVLQFAVGAALLGVLFAIYQKGVGRCSDFSEHYHQLIAFGGIGMMMGILSGMYVYEKKKMPQFNYGILVAIKYFIAFLLIYYGLNQVLDITFPQSLSVQEKKLVDLDAGQLVFAFFSHTYVYQAVIGGFQLLGCSLLFYRSTVPLGGIILSVIMTNVLLIQYNYDLCNKTDTSVYLFSSLYIMVPYFKNMLNTLVLNRSTKTIPFPIFDYGSHGYKALSILKIVFIVGIIIYYYNQTSRYFRYYRSNETSPIVGVWKIDKIIYDTTEMLPEELISFDRLFLDKFRMGAVKSNDSISYFEYMVDTTFHQLEFWNFHHFRHLDLKGKYQIQGNDTLIYSGVSNKDSIQMRMVRDSLYRVR